MPSNEVRFDVLATSDTATDDKLAKLSNHQASLEKEHMLQQLLADRFRLKAHIDTRVRPALTLFVLRRETGMDEPLDESEYADVTPNAKRNRQEQDEGKPRRASKRPGWVANYQQPLGECHRFDSQREFTPAQSMQFQSHPAQRVLIFSCRLAASRNNALKSSLAEPCWTQVPLAAFGFGRRRPITDRPFAEEQPNR